MNQISDVTYELLAEQVAKLNKRCVKLGLDPIVITVYEEGYSPVKYYDLFGFDHEVEMGWKVVSVSGDAPVINGWKIVANLDHQNESGNIVREFGGVEIPKSYYTGSAVCDHCGKARHRNKTYILVSLDNPECFKQVGSACLKDFTGYEYASYLVEFADTINTTLNMKDPEYYDKDLISGMSYSGKVGYDSRRFLALVGKLIKKYGWKSASSPVPGVCTADVASTYYGTKEEAELGITDLDCAETEEVFKWMSRMSGELRPYYHNLYVLSNEAFWKSRDLRLGASAYASWMHEQARIKELDLRRKNSTSVHQGQVGDKLDFRKVKVTHVSKHESMYGIVTLYKFVDEQGNIYGWWASSDQELDVEQSIMLRGTVKAHNEFNGEQETILTRCKIAEVAEA